jgi:hypothetical protein
MNKAEWTSELKDHIKVCRIIMPIPDRESLTPEDQGKCRAIGSEFLSWQKLELPQIMAYRIAARQGFDPEPLFVITTDLPGMSALKEILPEPPIYLVFLLHEEFEAWKVAHPVDSFTFHIHHWSFFEAFDSELLAQAKAAFPDVDEASLRLHQTGNLWAEQAGVTGQHLWQWDGQEMVLLKEAFGLPSR